MSVYTRPDSKFWWLWLETAPKGQQKVRTDIFVGTTPEDRKASKALALAVYGENMDAIGKRRHDLPGAQAPITFDTFAAWYETHIVPTHKGASHERERIARFRTAFGSLWLTDPRWPEKMVEYRTRRLTTPTRRIVKLKNGRTRIRLYPICNAKTVNRELTVLKQIFSKAAELHHLDRSPLAGSKALRTSTPKRRTMSDDEEQRILRELEPVDQAILIMGTDTLARLSNVINFRYDNDHGDHLYLPDPKNGVPITVPVSTRLRRALDAIPRLPGQPFYFHHRRRGASNLAHRNSFYKALRRACARADVPYGRTQHGITYHWSTRRTGATRMIRKGGEQALATVQAIGGWKDVGILVGIYREVSTDEMRAAVESVAPATGNLREYTGSETPKKASKPTDPSQPARRANVRRIRKFAQKIR
jgi:hypothetical protein